MLEFGGDELARRLGRMIAADPRLRVPLQFTQCFGDSGAVRLPDPVIAADKRGERYRLRGRKGCVPSGPVFDGFDGLAIGILVLEGGARADHGLLRCRVQSFREALKFER